MRVNPTLSEMVMFPWSALRRLQGVDRRPDVGRSYPSAFPVDKTKSRDPIERGSRAGDWVAKVIGIQRELTRLELYAIYREMDMDPLVTAVLDAYAEDATQRDFEHGRMVWVSARNDEVKKLVMECLERMGIEECGYPIVRSMLKYGDNFEHNSLALNEGIKSIRPYDPWDVGRQEDEDGRLMGFAPCDATGRVTKYDTNSLPFYKVLHFRLRGRERRDIYGSSLLWGSRENWRKLQLMEDQIVMQRLLRRPDRLLILMDVGGMSLAEAYEACKEWELRLYKEYNVDPVSGVFTSQGGPWHEARDLILPLGTNNQTKIETVPSTSSNDLMRDYDMMLSRFLGGLRVPKAYFGFEGNYEGAQSLGKQDVRFAKTVMRVQRAFLVELVRALMIDLAFHNIDPYREENAFRLHMPPASAFLEIERSELVQMRFDLMDRMVRMGNDVGFNREAWIPYVLEEFGQLPKQLIEKLLKPSATAAGTPWPQATPGARAPTYPSAQSPAQAFGEVPGEPGAGEKQPEGKPPAPSTEAERKALLMHTFLTEGMGMASSLEFREGKDITKEDWEKIKEIQKTWKEDPEEVFIAKPGVGEVSANGEHVRGEMRRMAENRVKALRGVASYPLTSGSGK